ncbi:MAG: caspase family protein [Pirellulaceae bacterium]
MMKHAALALLLGLAFAACAWSQESNSEPLAADHCVLQLNLPPGATVTIDGREYGDRRELHFRKLTPGQKYNSTLVVKFASGHREERKVGIEGGRIVRVALRDPTAKLPEVVLQVSEQPQYSTRSRDGRFLLTGRSFATLWDAHSGRALRFFDGHSKSLRGIGFSAQDEHVITAALDDKIIVWNRDTGERVREIDVGSCYDMQVSPDGQAALVATFYDGATLWNLSTGRKIRQFSVPFKGGVDEVAFDPTGRLIATTPSKKKILSIVLFEAATGRQHVELHGCTYAVDDLDFSPDGTLLAAVGSKKIDGVHTSKVLIWKTSTGELLRHRVFEGDFFLSIAFHADGDRLATVSYSAGEQESEGVFLGTKELRRVGEFDPQQSAIPREAKRNLSAILHCVAGPTDRLVLLRSDDLFDTASNEIVRTFAPPNENAWTTDGRFTPDFTKMIARVSGGGEESVCTWDVKTGAVLSSFPVATKKYSFTGLSVSADAKRALTRCSDGVYLWNTETGERVGEYGEGYRLNAALSPDGRLVLTQADSSNRYNIVDMWDADTQKKIRTIAGLRARWPRFDLKALAVTPDSQTIITAGSARRYGEPDQRGVAFLWDTSGSLKKALVGDVGSFDELDVSRDGRRLATNDREGATIVWDLATGERLFTTNAHATDYAPSLTRDGRRLWTVTNGGVLQLWDVDRQRELVRLVRLANREGQKESDWIAVTPEGLFDGTPRARKQVCFRVGDGLNVVPVDRFFQNFYYPGLMDAVLQGEQPQPMTGFAKSAAPRVRIVSPTNSSTTKDLRTVVDVEVTDLGGGVKEPWIVHNGARLLLESEKSGVGKTTRRRFVVPLVEGWNELLVYSASRDGSWESEPAQVKINHTAPVRAPSVFVLAVGITDYTEDTMDLRYAAADAKAAAKLFRTRAPALYGENNVHVVELLDNNATRKGINSALKSLAKYSRPQDTMVLVLAGHGTMLGPQYYFIPHEFRNTDARLDEDIRSQGIPADELNEAIAAVPALKRVVIYDTCQSGGVLPVGRTSRNPFAFRGALERMSRATGSFTIAAASASAEAHEVEQLGHGVLTYALLAGLGEIDKGPLKGQRIKSENQAVEVRDWFNFAQDKVPLLTKLLLGQEQHVGYTGQGVSFPVLPVKE